MADAPSKVLVIGSGPIVIGQAAEFDYAGTQACKALREEGITTVLVNSNPATIMTDEDIADVVYVEPLTVPVLERVIAAERPDGILPTLGGQTGLNLAVDLAAAGVLDRYDVRLLGTPLSAIRSAEDRELFRQLMADIGEPLPPNVTVGSVEEAVAAIPEIGLPMVVRPAYTLGGTGGGIAYNERQLREIVAGGVAASPIGQTLLEKALIGWKEVEYEVMRDGADNCITICNMENIDPMGVHTGDSIVVAPSQTLSDKEYQALRSASLKIIRALGIEGGCNVQLALEPGDVVGETLPGGDAARRGGFETRPAGYYVIEVNPRVSRSSALASKATGYPIARVAAKVAIGKRLDEIPNAVTKRTKAAFEPALDYCVVKIPRWPFDKFPAGDRAIGTQMKATGEVMAIDRSFEAAFQKAVRSLEITNRSLLWEKSDWTAERTPLHPHDERLWALLASLRRGTTAEELSRTTGIDPWFTRAFARIAGMERRLLSETLAADLMWDAKRLGFSDSKIGVLSDRTPEQVRDLRRGWGIRPVYKMVDTCAAEFEAETSYFYSTYEQENEAEPLPGRKAVVIGSGPIRIGQGIEFDYCSVHAAWALQQAGVQSVLINSNPETVSTDFDTSDRLYFEPLDDESVLDVLENETRVDGGEETVPPSVVQFGGQTAINLSQSLDEAGLPILGSTAHSIDVASDRHLFEDFLARVGIPNPPGSAVANVEQAVTVAEAIGYPVLVRPSYVLGGRAMEIVRDAAELRRYMAGALAAGEGSPRADRQVLRGPRGRGRRRLRRRVGPDPRHHGARRARRRPLRRLDGHLPRPDPDLRGDRHRRRLHDAHRPRAGRARSHEHPVRRPRRPGVSQSGAGQRRQGRRVHRGLRHRGEPTVQPHDTVHLQGHRRADGPARHQRDARNVARRAGLQGRPVEETGPRRHQGARLLHVQAGGRRHLPRARDEVDRGGHRARLRVRARRDQGAHGRRPHAARGRRHPAQHRRQGQGRLAADGQGPRRSRIPAVRHVRHGPRWSGPRASTPSRCPSSTRAATPTWSTSSPTAPSTRSSTLLPATARRSRTASRSAARPSSAASPASRRSTRPEPPSRSLTHGADAYNVKPLPTYRDGA